MKRIAIAVLASALSAVAVADDVEKPYLGFDYQLGKLHQSNGSHATLGAARLRVGSDVFQDLALEAHLGTGLMKDTLTLNGNVYKANLKGMYGLFLRPQMALGSNDVRVFLLGGYSYVDFDARSIDPAHPSFSGSSNGLSFGGGLDAGIGQGWRLQGDFIHYVKAYHAVSIGLSRYLD